MLLISGYKIFLLFLFSILLCSLTYAAPPPFQESNGDTGLHIVVPSVDYYLVNSEVIFFVHVFNSTGYVVDNTTTDCYMEAFNISGDHLINQEMLFNSTLNEFYVNVNSSINSQVGFFSFIVNCNNSREAGFYSGTVESNTYSRSIANDLDATQGVSIVLFLLFANAILFVIPFIEKTFSKSPITDLIIKRGFLIIGLYLMVMNSGVIAGVASAASYSVSEIFRLMWLFGMLGYLLIVVTLLKTLFDVLELWKVIVAEQRGLK